MTSANGRDYAGQHPCDGLVDTLEPKVFLTSVCFRIQERNLKKTINELPTRQNFNYFVLKVELIIYFAKSFFTRVSIIFSIVLIRRPIPAINLNPFSIFFEVSCAFLYKHATFQRRGGGRRGRPAGVRYVVTYFFSVFFWIPPVVWFGLGLIMSVRTIRFYLLSYTTTAVLTLPLI